MCPCVASFGVGGRRGRELAMLRKELGAKIALFFLPSKLTWKPSKERKKESHSPQLSSQKRNGEKIPARQLLQVQIFRRLWEFLRGQ